MILGLSIAVVLLAVLSLALGYVLWSRSRIQRGVWARLDPQDTSRDGFARMVAHLSLGSLVEGNAVTLLENGAFWDALRESIARAERSVHFETFLWKACELSASLVDAFCERARAGVDVRLIVDGEGGKLMSDDERERLRAAGVDLRLYRPRRFAHLGSYNGRDHRKLAVIDGRLAFVGGHCVTDEWTGDAQDREHFRDMTIRLEGPVVNHVQAAFSENWTEVSGRLLAGEDHFPGLDHVGEASVHLAYLGDARRVSAVKTLHVLAIESARESLLIMNPYFLPDDGAIEALGRATARGVRVRVMTPTLEATDNPLVVHAMMRELPRLLDAGLEVYGYDRTLLHQKVLSVDGCWSVVGSVNFDPRSFEINEEIAASVFDRALASKIEAAFDADVAHCVRYGLEHAEKRSVGSRLADHLAWGVRGQL